MALVKFDPGVLVLVWAFLPPTSFLLLMASYRLVINRKRMEMNRVMNEESLRNYSRTYGGGDIDDLIRQFLDLRPFIIPVLLNVLTTALVSTTYLVKAFAPVGGTGIDAVVARVPDAVFVGFAGAFLWSQFDAVRRYASIDLTPSFLYLVWIRFLIGGAIGALCTALFTETLVLIVAFLVGALPVDVIREWVRKEARTRLKIDSVPEAERPNLHRLDGATEQIIERLSEESITSIQHLAMVSPLRLLLRTNIEWLVILDLIDQALLHLYLAGHTEKLREICLRSSIEFAGLYESLKADDAEDRQRAEATIAMIAAHLQLDPFAVRFQVDTIGQDPQVEFIWSLWSESAGNDEEEGEEPDHVEEGGTAPNDPQAAIQ